ncbi:MAG: DUF47 family protein [Thermoproteota archaeon]
MSTWAWISRRREVEILSMELDHLKAVRDVAVSTVSEVEAIKRGDRRSAEEAYERVFEAERRADAIKAKIIDELMRGVIHPIDREEIVRLVLAADDVADHLKAGSRRLVIAARLGVAIPGFALEAFERLAKITLQAVEKLIDLVEKLKADPKEAIRMAGEVEALEEEADEVRMNAEEKLLRWCSDVDPGSCLVLYRVLESLETSSDKCENVADTVRSIGILSA